MKSLIGRVYRKHLPNSFQHKIDLIRGESQVFWPHFIDTGSLFIHIPKAAGTSIARSLYGRNVGHRKADFYQKVSRSQFEELFSFAFTRNPWSRAVSAYQFAKQGGTNLVQPRNDSIFKSKYFESFDNFVLNWLSYIDFDEEDLIFEPQYRYVCDKTGAIIVNFIGKTENISEDITYVQEKLRTVINIDHLNQSKHENYLEFYSTKTIDAIAKIYEKDIELFSYDI
ncbi:chondroitin 4-O-sulfotransferase [Catenovulum agarivorans DS-2]|uniref:Chondroitin 4-O-sulfotransferase n=1 Tax=Catenovulum agarivorans DS-2 TaxID=1328313 RepID=W7QQ91_9ALTE|nr:sulfotransferase family 2 domain-containing protein [Catenovulum agarivorans]EWH11147.1 chondroitin 4-O-sulfotransferase [Catenovulum agarivorans DS-2]